MPLQLKIEQTEGKPGEVYYPLKLQEVPKPQLEGKQVLVRLSAAALNHRDVFIRQHLYPAISFDSPMLADGCGTVVEVGPACKQGDKLMNKRVVLLPCVGWDSDPEGPERPFAVIGSSKMTPLGTGQEYVAVDEDSLELAPDHLSDTEAAALPLAGLTAWRAFVTKTGTNSQAGRNILVTGIGGGVALNILQFAVGKGCNVYVTSGSEDKIEKAKKLGAKGGVNYKNAKWNEELMAMLPEDRKFIDAIVDGAGGDILMKTLKVLKRGGVISQYGMTVAPIMQWHMSAVLKNIELRGSTMGSRTEFAEMIDFVREKKIKPVIHRVVKGLDNLDELNSLFEDMKKGAQFGKLVVEYNTSDASAKM